MKAELAAIRDFTGLQHKGRVQVPKLDGFSRAETQLISQMAERGIRELLSFCFHMGYNGGCKPLAPGVVCPKPLTERYLQIAMRRFVAVAWMLHSEMLVGEELDEHGHPIPLSLAQLGAIPQLSCTKVALSLLAKRFGEQFNLHTRVQKRRGTRINYAASAKTGWAKRRARIAQRTKRRKKK